MIIIYITISSRVAAWTAVSVLLLGLFWVLCLFAIKRGFKNMFDRMVLTWSQVKVKVSSAAYLSLRWWFWWRQQWRASWTFLRGVEQPSRWPCGRQWLIWRESWRRGSCCGCRPSARIQPNQRCWWRSDSNAPSNRHCSSLVVKGTWHTHLPNRWAWSTQIGLEFHRLDWFVRLTSSFLMILLLALNIFCLLNLLI